jgi:hypothetical protein
VLFVGRLFGLVDREMPDTSRDLEIYLHDMIKGETLHVSAQARRLGVEIVLNPRCR